MSIEDKLQSAVQAVNELWADNTDTQQRLARLRRRMAHETAPAEPISGSRDTGSYRCIVFVDIVAYSAQQSPVQQQFQRVLPEVIGDALQAAGVSFEAVTRQYAGDGMVMVMPSEVSPIRMVDHFIRALDDNLTRTNLVARVPLRLRVALHNGLAIQGPNGWQGEAMMMTARLLESQPLRDTLKAAPSARMAVAVSDETYRSLVEAGARGIDSDSYTPMLFSDKRGPMTAWVTVPGHPAPPGTVRPFAAPETAVPNHTQPTGPR